MSDYVSRFCIKGKDKGIFKMCCLRTVIIKNITAGCEEISAARPWWLSLADDEEDVFPSLLKMPPIA